MVPQNSNAQAHQTFQGEREVISNAKWRLGPVFLLPNILFNISYDNNIFGAGQTDAPVGDYLATASLSVRAGLLYRKWLLISFSEDPTYIYYFQLSDYRILDNSYSAGSSILLFNRFSLSGNYESLTQTGRLTSEMDHRITQSTDAYRVSVFLETPRGTSLGFSGSNAKYSYEDATLTGGDVPLSVALDRTERNARVEFYYSVSSEAQFFSNFGYTEYLFNDTEASYRNSYSYQTYSGIAFPILRGRARGILSLGYKILVPEQNVFNGFAGIVGDTSFSIRTGKFEWAIVFIRDIPFSFGSNIYYVYDNYGGGLSFYLSQDIRLNYKYSQGAGNYPEPQETTSPDGNIIEINRKDTYQSHSAGIAIRIYRDTGIGFTVEFSKRRSNFTPANIDRTIFGANITSGF